MAELDKPRFQLVDEEGPKDLVNAGVSDNTKKQVKYVVKIFEEHLKATNVDCRLFA